MAYTTNLTTSELKEVISRMGPNVVKTALSIKAFLKDKGYSATDEVIESVMSLHNSVPFINTKSNRRSIGKSMFGSELQNAKKITIDQIVNKIAEMSSGDMPSFEEIELYLDKHGYEISASDISSAIKRAEEYMND